MTEKQLRRMNPGARRYRAKILLYLQGRLDSAAYMHDGQNERARSQARVVEDLIHQIQKMR